MDLANRDLDWPCLKMIEKFTHWASSPPLRQLIKFGLVGLFSNLAGYLVYLLITSLGIEHKVTMSLLYAIGTIISYVGNRKWTFASEGSTFMTSVKHIVVFAIGYMLNFAILVVFVDKLGFAHQIVQAIAILIIALFLFVAMKFFVFPKAGKQ